MARPFPTNSGSRRNAVSPATDLGVAGIFFRRLRRRHVPQLCVDRTLTIEPPYRSSPRHCLLVFGPEATMRVWLVQDGDMLYVVR
jgi:hypothetical protein